MEVDRAGFFVRVVKGSINHLKLGVLATGMIDLSHVLRWLVAVLLKAAPTWRT